MITNIRDVARILKEAHYIASTGRPGPVLVDFPKDVQLDSLPLEDVDFDPPMNLPGYRPQVPPVRPEQVRQIIAAIRRAKRPCSTSAVAASTAKPLKSSHVSLSARASRLP
ncbi:MAG UNVERIFIED_CONTAM: hypothetical protein LVR18_00835 [Planctomycetaceae bacterium]